ncbi:MAG TPA: hypothetical protein VGF62_06760 [Rhizomicrobium sp.]|jgi:hypothetical protein
MQAELRIRRAAAGGFVLLLHIVVLLALLAAFQPQLFQQTIGTREITVSLPIVPETSRRPPQLPTEIAPPTLLVPEVPRAITLPSLEAPPPAAEQQPQGDIRALGRYLYNCTGLYYERLSAKEKAHCLENKFNGQEGPTLTLGPAKPSPYDAVIAGRNAPAVPIEKPCPVDKPTANLGLPCFSFEGSHAPLVEFHH